MRTWVALLAFMVVPLFFASPADAKDIDWTKMDEDVLVMNRLVAEALGAIHSEEAIEPSAAVERPSPTGSEEEVAVAVEEAGKGSRVIVARGGRSRQALLSIGLQPDLTGLYLPGYGVVIMGRVRLPISPPPEVAPPEAAEKESRWQNAREEALGIAAGAGATARSYDDKLVAKVKDALVDLLSSEARNLTELLDEDRVTILLYGPAATRAGKGILSLYGEREERREDALAMMTQDLFRVYALSGEGREYPLRSVLALTVKAADLQAQRQGKLTVEEVKKRIELNQR